MSDFIPDAEFKPDAPLAQAPAAPPASNPNFIPDDQFQSDQDKYGGVGGQIGAGLAGIARGATLGASDVALTKSGLVSPETLKGQAEANPWTSGAGNVVGAGALLYGTGGLAAPAEAAVGAGVGATALAGAGEGALFGAGSAVSDAALGDPNLNAQKIATQVGLGAILGGFTGAGTKALSEYIGSTGKMSGSISESLDKEAMQADKAAEVSQAVAEDRPIPDARNEAAEAGQELGLPTPLGLGSAKKNVQQSIDSLLNSSPTVASIKTVGEYAEAHNAAVNIISDIAPETEFTQATAGQAIQGGLISKLESQYAEKKALYAAIKEVTPSIPLSDRSAPAIARNLLKMPEVVQMGNSPQARLIRAVAENIQNAKTVEDLAFQRSAIRGMANSAIPEERRVAAIIANKIGDWEESSVLRYANRLKQGVGDDPEKIANFKPLTDKLDALLPAMQDAKAQYKPFIEDVKTLSEQLGKGKVYGPQDAIDFMKNLDVEDVSNRILRGKSQFRSWFAEKFPQEMAIIKEYQKGQLRDAASKSGSFDPKAFFNKLNKMEPEIQRSIFEPDELAKLQKVQTYLRGFPPKFNPSGTAGASAFREFFKSPSGMLIANGRDAVIRKFVQMHGALPNTPDSGEFTARFVKQFGQLNAAKSLADKTDTAVKSGIQEILSSRDR